MSANFINTIVLKYWNLLVIQSYFINNWAFEHTGHDLKVV